jgi:hypothetical protein
LCGLDSDLNKRGRTRPVAVLGRIAPAARAKLTRARLKAVRGRRSTMPAADGPSVSQLEVDESLSGGRRQELVSVLPDSNRR